MATTDKEIGALTEAVSNLKSWMESIDKKLDGLSENGCQKAGLHTQLLLEMTKIKDEQREIDKRITSIEDKSNGIIAKVIVALIVLAAGALMGKVLPTGG